MTSPDERGSPVREREGEKGRGERERGYRGTSLIRTPPPRRTLQ